MPLPKPAVAACAVFLALSCVPAVAVEIAPTLPSATELEGAQARIGAIFVNVGDIFDTTKPGENKRLYRFANRVHIDTHESVLRAQLLFAEGDLFSERVLTETERTLRRLRYIREPKVRAVAFHDGLVDVEVTASDVWTMSPGLSFGRKGGANSTSVEFDDYNVLGMGKRLSIGSSSNAERSSTTFEWKDPNVLGSRWTSAASYADSDDGNSSSFDIERPFFSFDTRWTAGLSIGQNDGVLHRYALGERVDEFRRDTRTADLHFGTSRGWDDGWVRRFTAGLRLDQARFGNDATYLPSANLPDDRRLTYPYASMEWIQDDFVTSTNLDQIERTEDFEFGKRFTVELGQAAGIFGADRTATLVRASASRGWRIHPHHTFFFGANLASRIGQGNDNSLFSAAARYFWRTSDNTLFYASLQGDLGHALDADNDLSLGGDNGLRGYPLRYQTGNARGLLTVEQRFFTKWYPWHLFNVGAAVFADVGRTFGAGAIETPQLGMLRDVGFGLRLSNSRSALANVLHIDIAFPLNGDSSLQSMQFLIQTKRSF
jgi:outer membrane protein assembly factor BamA